MSLDYDQWSAALAQTESGTNWKLWGDEGQAMSQWQMHPSFVQEWSKGEVWGLDWTWNGVCGRALYNFFMKLAPLARASFQSDSLAALHLAMWFHLHGNPGGGWDQAYADRFEVNYSEVVSA